MYELKRLKSFEKDIKRCNKRNYNLDLLLSVIKKLAKKGNLVATYKPHKLTGNYTGHWEAHIKPD